jgi:hypothetical protein
MAIPYGGIRNEDLELITSNDLISAAHALLGEIDLDPASSDFANEYVGAKKHYTPSDDGLNAQEWAGKVYLFPPSGTYFWSKKEDRWRMIRGGSHKLVSSHAVWFRKLYKSWFQGEVTEALFFCNSMDMFRFEQIIFDFPICVLRTPPVLIGRTSKEVRKHRTCTSFLVYLQPKENVSEATEKFIDIYSEKGRVLY